MDGDAEDCQRYAGDKPCRLTEEIIDSTDTSQREEKGDGIKINLQIRSLHAEHGSLEYLQTGREECRRQIEEIDEYCQTETADKHLDSDSCLQEKERKGKQQSDSTHHHIIIEAILQHLFNLDRLGHQTMEEVCLNAKGPLRQHHRWQQDGTRHIEGSHSHLVPHFLSRFCREQGKEIGIEKEDGSNHNHHRTNTLCSQCADILQTEEVDMAETTEPGNLLLLLVINLFVIEIDGKSGEYRSCKEEETYPSHIYREERSHKHIPYEHGKHSHPSQYQRPFQNPLRSLAVTGDVDAVDKREPQEQKEADNSLTCRQEIDKHRKRKHRKHIVPEAHEIGGEQELVPDLLWHRARLHIIIHCRNIPLHHHLHDDVWNQHTDNDTGSQQGRHVFAPKFSPILGEAEKEAHTHHHIQEDDVARHEGISLVEVTALLQPPKP